MYEFMRGDDDKVAHLDEVDVYYPWVRDVLRSGNAGGAAEQLTIDRAAICSLQTQLNGSYDYQKTVQGYLDSALNAIDTEMNQITNATVTELNAAMTAYALDFFVTTNNEGGWWQVQGFARAKDFTIRPIIDGELYDSTIRDIKWTQTDKGLAE